LAVNPEVARGPASAAEKILEHLSRRTSSRRFIPEVDGLRFVAVAGILAVHVSSLASGAYLLDHPGGSTRGTIWGALLFGRYGVQLFFVLSGFVLALPFASHHLSGTPAVSLRWYYLRRITRLEPPYIVSLTVFVIVLNFLPGGHTLTSGQPIGPLLPHYLTGLFYLHGWTYGTQNPINLLTWSLEVEVQFYVVVPLLVAVFRIRERLWRRATLVAACGAVEVLQSSWISGSGRLALSLLGSLQYFVAGFLLADIYLLDWRRSPTRRVSWDIATLVAVVLMARTLPTRSGPYVFPFLILLLVIGGFRGRLSSAFLRTRWVYTIGGMCYSIYLVHGVVLRLGFRSADVLGRADSPLAVLGLAFAVYIPLILSASAAFFVLVERPCMNPDWPTRLLNSGPLAGRFSRDR